MTLFHESWRRRVSLLAAGSLEGAEREATLGHVEACSRCREELQSLTAVMTLLEHDPVRSAEPPIPLAALRTRVLAQLEAPRRAESRWRAPMLAWNLALAASAAGALLLVLRYRQPSPPPPVEVARETPRETAPVADDLLRRMESQVVREQTARYLSEAQDVLVTMASRPQDCDKANGRVDVGAEARRSRELLARRALLVEIDRAEMAPARPVLEDVERLLREVAALESCAHSGDIEAIHRQIEERRLLMKIDLMARELAG